ncbi:MAG: phosphatase PAP2 family protein [Oscillospiraceae bacterium]
MIQHLDESALLFIQEHARNDFLTPLFKFFTYMGNAGILWILLGTALLLFAHTRKRGAIVLCALGISAVLNNLILKNIVARPRPYTVLPELEVLVAKLSSYSFPSGHACSSFAAATALTLLFGKRGAWSFAPAALIALSRVYLGVHYPTDVLSGAVLGAVCAWATVMVFLQKTNWLK